jgi:heme-degrading monooxygenase HmoA
LSLPPSAEPIARTPAPPYLAVIFTSLRKSEDEAGYAAMAAEMDALARQQPGFLGVESTRGADRLGITVSYWIDEAAVLAWKRVAEHVGAQRLGRERWYADYTLRVARVERSYTLASSPRVGL